MKRILFLLIAVVGLSITVFAQDEPITWTPNADDIFSEYVTVESVEDTSALRGLKDNETRTIRIEEGGIVTRTIPYPPSLDSIEGAVELQSDETLLIGAEYESESRLYRYLVYNLATGEISPAPTVCNGYLKDNPDNARWAYVSDFEGIHLCNTATDERYGVLPENVVWGSNQWDTYAHATTSPDGKWVVLTAIQRTETAYYNFEYYSFELATSKPNYLGTIEHDMFASYMPQFGEWVSDSLGAIHYSTDPESISNGFYVFDVTQPNSLILGAQGWVYDFYDDPPRYEYVVTDQFMRYKTGAEPQEHIACSLMVYDANGLRNFDLGYDCGRYSSDNFDCVTSLHRVDDDYVYLQFDEDSTVMSSVMWLDTETGETRSLLQGEIEALVDVSPDGQYFAIVGGHTGQVDAVDNWCSSIPDESPSLYIASYYDVLYQADSSGGSVYWGESTISIIAGGSQQRFSMIPNGDTVQVRSNHMPSIHTLHLSDTGELEQTEILKGIFPIDIQAVSPNQEQFIVGNRQPYLYDVQLQDFIPIIDVEDMLFDEYTYRYVWDESGLQVIISPQANYQQQMTYRITLELAP